ncbi:MAG: SMC-Scp complex subunit ScpB [Oscillospiraceae bacterium]|nr:SMC-Scp complex subunit ScpB [Oscillospiraceae bacterium]
MDNTIEAALEAVLFASGDPVSRERLAAVLAVEETDIDTAAQSVARRLEADGSGIRLKRLEDDYQLCSAPEYADYVRIAIEARKPPRLSQTAMEVLAVVAYYQPVTKAYIEKMRGVDSSYTVNMLCDRALIELCGQLEAPGRPNLYRTTPEFLRAFGISSVSELPPLPETVSDDGEKQKLRQAIDAIQSQ